MAGRKRTGPAPLRRAFDIPPELWERLIDAQALSGLASNRRLVVEVLDEVLADRAHWTRAEWLTWGKAVTVARMEREAMGVTGGAAAMRDGATETR